VTDCNNSLWKPDVSGTVLLWHGYSSPVVLTGN